MMRTSLSTRTLATAALSVCLWSCTSTTLLSADFEGDVVGGQPDFTLPGAPAGDSIGFDAGGDAADRLMLQVGSPGATNELRYRSINPSRGGGNTVEFLGAAPSATAESFVALWHGRIEFDHLGAGGETDLSVSLFRSSSRQALILRPTIDDGEKVLTILRDRTPSELTPDYEVVAVLPAETKHRVRIAYNMDGRFSAQFQWGTGEVSNFSWVGISGLRTPSVAFQYATPFAFDATYSIEDIEITQAVFE